MPVFFSIPYEDGWSAYVNGEKVDIEKVNVGFMAIRVNAGTNVKIEFKYRTPGLFLGVAITVVCVLLLALYMVLMRTIFKEVPVPLARHNMVLRPLSHYAKSTARILKTADLFT